VLLAHFIDNYFAKLNAGDYKKDFINPVFIGFARIVDDKVLYDIRISQY